MNICILNGSMEKGENSFSKSVEKLKDDLEPKHQCRIFPLQEMNLKYCTGCWSCWWKTPGLCAMKDDAEQIFRTVIHADLLIFASPLMAGFTSSVLKRITDRLIVLLHPYIQLIQKENHHRKRYDSYPDIGILLGKEECTDDEDIEIVGSIYDRLAINFHSNKRFVKMLDEENYPDIIREIESLKNKITKQKA